MWNRTRRSTTFAVAAIILLHFWAGLKYSLAIPAWEAYDEPGHFGYIATILNDHRLPQNDDPILNNERIQPPLYYLAQAIFLSTAGSDVNGFHFPEVNSYFWFGQARNYAIVPPSLTDAERQVEIALHLARLGSLLLSLLAIPFVWLAARRAFPNQTRLALMAVAVFALWPQFLFSSSTVTNDGPMVVIGASVTWLLLRRDQRWRGYAVCLGLIVVGAMIKLNVVMLGVVWVGVLLNTARAGHDRPLQPILRFLSKREYSGSPLSLLVGDKGRGLGGAVFISLLLPVVFFLLLKLLPTMLLPFAAVTPMTILTRLFSPHGVILILQALYFAARSSFALFGWGNVPLPAGIQVLWVIGAICAGIGLIRVRNAYARNLSISIVLVLIIGALALVLAYDDVALIPGRYLLPGLSAFNILLVMGWQRFRLSRAIGTAALIGLMVLSINVPLFLSDAYKYPSIVAQKSSFHYDSVEFASGRHQ